MTTDNEATPSMAQGETKWGAVARYLHPSQIERHHGHLVAIRRPSPSATRSYSSFQSQQSLRQESRLFLRLEGIWQGLSPWTEQCQIKPTNRHHLSNIQSLIRSLSDQNAQISIEKTIHSKRQGDFRLNEERQLVDGNTRATETLQLRHRSWREHQVIVSMP